MNSTPQILVVEDNPILRKTLADIIGNKGYECFSAASGKAALKIVEDQQLDVALIDLKLGDMSGLEIMRAIKEQSLDTECIVVTGHASQSSAIDAVNLGVYSYLVKPYDMNQLLLTIHRALEKREAKEALREREASLLKAQQLAKLGNWSHDLNSGKLKWSREVFAMFGRDTSKPPPSFEALQRLYHPDDLQMLLRNVELAMSKGQSFSHEIRVIQPGGLVRWAWELGEAERDETGEIVKLFGTTQDITERKNAERQIQRQLQRISALRKIDETISASMDLQLTLDVILRQVTSQLGVDAADILLFKPKINTLESAARTGFRTSALQYTNLRIGQSLAGRAALERRVVNISNFQEDSDAVLISSALREERFITYYGVPLIAKGEVKGVLEVFHRHALSPDSEWLNFLEALSRQAAIAIDNATLFNDLQASNLELTLAYDTTLEGWALALELRDFETEGHSRRVTDTTMHLAEVMSVPEDQIVHVRRGALLHDIGKMGIPDSILQKQGPLTDEEWDIMRQHPVYAQKLLSRIPYLRKALDIPYCHHEKWDGTGYPRGISGLEIPLAARIFAVVDVRDALLSARPYRDAWGEEDVHAYILDQANEHFDPQVVEVFFQALEEVKIEV